MEPTKRRSSVPKKRCGCPPCAPARCGFPRRCALDSATAPSSQPCRGGGRRARVPRRRGAPGGAPARRARPRPGDTVVGLALEETEPTGGARCNARFVARRPLSARRSRPRPSSRRREEGQCLGLRWWARCARRTVRPVHLVPVVRTQRHLGRARDPDLAQRHQVVEPGRGRPRSDEPHEVGEARLVGQPVVDGHEIARRPELTDRSRRRAPGTGVPAVRAPLSAASGVRRRDGAASVSTVEGLQRGQVQGVVSRRPRPPVGGKRWAASPARKMRPSR